MQIMLIKYIYISSISFTSYYAINCAWWAHINIVFNFQGGGDPLEGAEKAREVVESVEERAKESVDTAWDAAKKSAELVTDTTTAEADTNVVDTVEYRSAEDLSGQLGDGCDKIEL